MAVTSATVYAELKAIFTSRSYTYARDFFDFDHLPDSVAHKSFRIAPGSVEYDMASCPGVTFFKRTYEVWVAFRPQANDDGETLRTVILPAEDTILGVLRAGSEITLANVTGVTAEYGEGATDFILWQLSVELTYKI